MSTNDSNINRLVRKFIDDYKNNPKSVSLSDNIEKIYNNMTTIKTYTINNNNSFNIENKDEILELYRNVTSSS